MHNRLTKQSVVSYTPAVQAVAAQAAYCTEQQVTSYQYRINGVVAVSSSSSNDNALVDVSTLSYSSGTTWVSGEYVKVTTTKVVCYPAVAAVAGRAASVTVDLLTGWNAGALSLDSIPDDAACTFDFAAAPAAAVLCGLAPATVTVGSFAGIEHGLYCDGSYVKAYESGVLAHTFAARGSESPDLRIQREGNQVTYLVDSETYDSNRPSIGSKVLAASLYAGGDYVENPTIGALVKGTLADPRLALGGVLLGVEAAVAQASGRLALAGSAYGKISNASTTPPSVATSSINGVVQLYGALQGKRVRQGDIAGNLQLQMLAAMAPYAALAGTLPALQMSAWSYGAERELVGLYGELVGVVDSCHFDPVLFATLQETLALGDTFDLMVVVSASVFDTLLVQDRPTATMVLQALLRQRLSFSDNATHARSQALQYATNLATGGVTRYEGFDFLGFAQVDLISYAYKADGLYQLGAENDDGETLAALVDFAAEDFGTSALKRLDTFYLGMATDGVVLLRLTDDEGREHVYQVEGDAPTMRAPVGRGLQSRLWHLRLQVSEATGVDLESVEWTAPVSTRRTTRR
ncbi:MULTISPECIES: hypothetical protein [unclassified Pseudomonas]|uniref:hypothetical protein n=1 Tax=unclassified Pseudomonas TaxID=196821 RepID=UPI00131DE875|nr:MULTISPECIES: hypothetical protein [unclassified Pseudomonas]